MAATGQHKYIQSASTAYIICGLVDRSGGSCRGNCLAAGTAAASSSWIILAMLGEECDRERPPPLPVMLARGVASVLRDALYDWPRPASTPAAHTHIDSVTARAISWRLTSLYWTCNLMDASSIPGCHGMGWVAVFGRVNHVSISLSYPGQLSLLPLKRWDMSIG